MAISSGLLPSFGAVLSASVPLNCSISAIQSVLPVGADVDFVQTVAVNSTFEVPPENIAFPISPVGLPSLCAVSAWVQAPGNTSFGFGLFLPGDWNGRFLAVGNAGFAGGINWLEMGTQVRYGFATMSTDTGHSSNSTDGRWAYKQPEVINNWGYRALHGSVVTAKQITEAFYAQKPTYSYYSGCSTGGRQGFKEAQMFPDDFDGIVAGAPSWYTKHLQTWVIRYWLNNVPNTDAHHIPPELFPVIGAEALRQCDPQDGLTDSIISDPYNCNFRPEALLCGVETVASNSTAATCLTSSQIDTVKKIYSDWVEWDQRLIYPHVAPGSEASWGVWLLNSSVAPSTYGTDYVKYFLGLGPDWSPWSLNDSIVKFAEKDDPGNASVDTDLSAFQKKGGKLISFHGFADSLVPSAGTTYFYDQVDKNLKPQGIKTSDFFRVFMVPGMGHCGGTTPSFNASWYFAGGFQASLIGPTVHSVPGFSDAKHDILLALTNWVENGTAPDSVIATKWTNDTEHTTVLRQRPICRYPEQAKYTGSGDPNQADSWECRLPWEEGSGPLQNPGSVGSSVFHCSHILRILLVVIISSYSMMIL
ncbi:putative ferulic acid Esterase/Feruloyl esterase [Lophiotrema nucula]|uniref:Carboxylic ester hydrolase n=1 Tax=Lophiotrema nucula TaxID=690887 RepID=A0A6A5ZET1_9PLEO|nr:putative ferulic acid Esterase/Feruloyl esterase [Lophiotrema nucula]